VVHEVVPWQVPDQFAEMARRDAVLENAADITQTCLYLWGNHEAAREAK
jgi:hypothetical protein